MSGWSNIERDLEIKFRGEPRAGTGAKRGLLVENVAAAGIFARDVVRRGLQDMEIQDIRLLTSEFRRVGFFFRVL
jgi:hypothetical protein